MKVYAVLYSKDGGVFKLYATKKMAEAGCAEVQGFNDHAFHVEEYEVGGSDTVYILEDTDYGTNIAWSLDRAEIEELGKQLGHWVAFIKEITNTKDRYDGKLA